MQTGTVSTDLDGLWDFSDIAASEERFREAMAESDGVAHALLRTQLARALGLQRRFAEGHLELDSIEGGLSDRHPEIRTRCELERGRLFNSEGDRVRASSRFRVALDSATGAGLDALAVDAAHMLGISETGPAAMHWTQRAIEMSQSSEDPDARKWLASLLNNLGWSQFEQGEYEQALDCFERALEARAARGDEEQTRIARWCVGRCLRAIGRWSEARAIQQELEAAYAAAGSPSGYVYEELGECALLDGGHDVAAPWFRRAYELLSRDGWLVERESERLARLKRLGEGEAGID